jgi:hypothetical protein
MGVTLRVTGNTPEDGMDIVERLRARNMGGRALLREAATEIERLQELAGQGIAIEYQLRVEIERMRAEIEGLKKVAYDWRWSPDEAVRVTGNR